ncbi:MAG TPA: hypothetical protein P5117_12430, partial [Spirochaetia bacterium]|nr:hypothetical protein [Spirochaetia bacterium]
MQFHVDMDAFYASVEQLDRPELALAALTTHLTLKLLADPLHGAYRLPNLLAISATGNQHELR